MRKAWKIIKRVFAVFLVLVAVLLSAATAVAIPLSNNYAAMVSMALGQSTVEKKGGSNPQYYESAYSSEEAVAVSAEEMCKELEREGMVLLKNEDQTLPLAQGAKVSLLGQNSVDLVYGGAGAGSVDTSKAGNLRQSMESAGFEVNGTLWDFYETGAGAAYRKEVPSVTGAGNLAAHEVPQAEYTQDVFQSMEEYSDAGIVVIGRGGSESMDLPAAYLEFTQEELDLIKMAKERFDTTVLVLNTTNAMNLSALENYDIDACLWVGALGQSGVYAVGEALSGAVNPTGHLVDTYACDPGAAPAMENFGDYTITNSEVFAGNKYIVYAEGIYVGYRYYETRYEDVVLGNESAANYNYAASVQFPFGYGLSYTEFTWSDYKVTEEADSFAVSVTVENSGAAAGKETVQIYMQSPYTQYDRENHIEKASVELAGFAKTKTLGPGEKETVTVTVPKELLKTYDSEGSGTYIVEAGDYYLSAGKNAHDALNNILAAKGKSTQDGMTAEGNPDLAFAYTQHRTDTDSYAVSAQTGEKIVNQMEDVDIRCYDSSFAYLSRSDWTGTWPALYGNGSWEAPGELLAALEIPAAEESSGEQMPTFGTVTSPSGELMLADLIGADFDDSRWEDLLNQISKEELYNLVRHSGYGTYAISSVGLPGTIQKDGPAGISSTLAGGNLSCMAYPPEVLVASTWNLELVEEFGKLIGEDSLSSGVSVWYAPAMNIHRTARSGRNFEYYSEDAFLSGKMGAAEVAGVQAMGAIVTIKHFALNDQETNRVGGAVFSNEQAARELYLKPFELSITEGNANGIMSSMNRIGARWMGAHRGVLTNIVRGEWDFEGFIITDQTSFSSFDYCDIRAGLAAGNDMWLNTANNMWVLKDEEMTASVMQSMRTAAHRFLYVVANSNAMNGVDRDTQVLNVKAGWQKLIPVLVIVILLIDVGVAFAVYGLWGTKKHLQRKQERKERKKAAKGR